MIGYTLLLIQGILFLPAYPESTSVTVINLIEEQTITSVHLLLPNSDEIAAVQLDSPISSGETTELSFPWGYINRIVFSTERGDVYYQTGFVASSCPDTLKVSLAAKEFGGVFDRIYGTHPIIVRNRTGVNIASVLARGESLPQGDILGRNPIMPGESLRLWVESTEPCSLVFIDLDGFPSDTLIATANPDTIYQLTNEMFYHNGTHHSTADPGHTFTVANCMSSETLVSVEALDEGGYSILFFDLTQTPLETWDRLTTQTDYPPALVISTDSMGREYSLTGPNPETRTYEFDLLSLDFDFSFPERR